MKKFLAMILALVMVFSLAACGGDNAEGSKDPGASNPGASNPGASDPVQESENLPPVEAEEIPYTPINYWGFENTDGLAAVYQADITENPQLTGAAKAIMPSVHEIMIAEGQGAVGNALYLDGKYGVKLDMKAPSDDSYTISFWYNADRVGNFGPVVQMGRNVGMAATDDIAVTWFNFTKTDWAEDIMPVVWNKNTSIGTEVEAGGVNPWVAPVGLHGKKEWCLCTVVVDGNRYVADDGMERIGTKLYVNGELAFDASAEFMFYQGVAPEIFLGDALFGLEAYVGINYWDTVFKGFVDELYVYDEALTAGMVKTLYNQGNPPATPVAPEYNGPVDGDGDAPEPAEPIDPDTLTAAPVDSSAIDTMGTPDRVCEWLSDNTGSYEIPVGKTVTFKFNNYSNGRANWNNLSLAFCDKEFSTDVLSGTVEGMIEYVSIRADAWDWGSPGGDNAAVETIGWTDWTAWLNLMTNAKVTVECSRDGANCIANFTFTGADGTVMTLTQSVATTLTDDLPLYVYFRSDGAYVELLSVE